MSSKISCGFGGLSIKLDYENFLGPIETDLVKIVRETKRATPRNFVALERVIVSLEINNFSAKKLKKIQYFKHINRTKLRKVRFFTPWVHHSVIRQYADDSNFLELASLFAGIKFTTGFWLEPFPRYELVEPLFMTKKSIKRYFYLLKSRGQERFMFKNDLSVKLQTMKSILKDQVVRGICFNHKIIQNGYSLTVDDKGYSKDSTNPFTKLINNHVL